MKLFKIYKKLLFENIILGKYWIDDNGKFLNVGYNEHIDFLIDNHKLVGIQILDKNINNDSQKKNDLLDKALYKGWIRATFRGNNTYIYWNYKYVSNKALKSFIKEVFKQTKTIKKIFIDTNPQENVKYHEYDFENEGLDKFFKDFKRYI